MPGGAVPRPLPPAPFLLFVLLALGAALLLLRPHTVSRDGTRPLMDTFVTVRVRAASDETARGAVDSAFAELERVAGLLDWFDTTGVVGRPLEAIPGDGLEVPREVAEVLETALEVARLSGGAFDPTIRPVTALWHFDSDPRVPSEAALRSALGQVGFERVRVEGGRVRVSGEPVRLDLGGVAKGFAVDRAIAVLSRMEGVEGALVAAAGDIRVFGEGPRRGAWMIGLAHPRRQGEVIARFPLKDGAVSTSGDYEQFFFEDGVRYHHLLDPGTGYPARRSISATVFAPDGAHADAMATALFVLGPDRGLEVLDGVEACEAIWIVDDGGRLAARSSPGLSGRVEVDLERLARGETTGAGRED